MVSELNPGASNSPSPLRDGMSTFPTPCTVDHFWAKWISRGLADSHRDHIWFLVFLIGLQAGLVRIPPSARGSHGRATGAATPGLILFCRRHLRARSALSACSL